MAQGSEQRTSEDGSKGDVGLGKEMQLSFEPFVEEGESKTKGNKSSCCVQLDGGDTVANNEIESSSKAAVVDSLGEEMPDSCIQHEQPEKASPSILFKKLQEQEFRCSLTGIKLTPDVAQVDHIIPVSCGGSDAIDNLQWVHSTVNKMKSTLTQTEFLDICRKVTVWNR